MHDLSTYDDVVATAARIAGHINRTSIMSLRILDEEFGAKALFKCENPQCMGTFKFCGTFNAPSRSSAEQRAVGVVVFSSDNHTQAITLSARLLGIPVTIMMPANAPAVKIEVTRGYDGQVVFYGRYTEDREQIGRGLVQRYGLTLIPPYDHPDVLAGQGTAAKKLFEEAGPLDAFFASPGGDGLFSGCTLAIRALAPARRVYGVEPETGDNGRRSLHSGAIVHIDTPQTLANSAQTQHLGNLIFPLI